MSVPVYAVLLLVGVLLSAPAPLQHSGDGEVSLWAACMFFAGLVVLGAGIGAGL